MVSDTLKVLDRVCDVCSKPVTDKEVCKTMIVKALQNNGCVDMIIERPRRALSDPNANAQRNAVNVKLNEGANKSRMCQLIGSDFTTDQENQMMVCIFSCS
ncbi:unnamed protein product [Nippostrongylus brasiliensis]|uniref:Saposin B-type domain-containing protein n=1 Tax=Nippostrongylus brasiliensis TaxID=27835 RepID=A0A0N4YBU2_NIPBR|nr:unnamed protein product [Nippostrongylus brasiliensis]